MQAVLILAHKNIDQVIELAERLSSTFNVYIHLDKKTNLTPKQKENIKKVSTFVVSKYDVKWGSYSIVKATIDLMKVALENKQNTYFHLISGQDWPMQSPHKIYNFFEKTDRIFMNYWQAVSMKKTGEPEIWWTKYYFNYDQINRRTFRGKVYHRLLLLVQTILRINKLKKYGVSETEIYAGQQWIDIPRDALEYLLNYYQNNPKWEKIFSTGFCSDEMWAQTILCNSKFKDRIDRDIHHYINTITIHGSTNPTVLTENDYSKIIKGNYWWGRKVELPKSSRLLEMLDSYNDKN